MSCIPQLVLPSVIRLKLEPTDLEEQGWRDFFASHPQVRSIEYWQHSWVPASGTLGCVITRRRRGYRRPMSRARVDLSDFVIHYGRQVFRNLDSTMIPGWSRWTVIITIISIGREPARSLKIIGPRVPRGVGKMVPFVVKKFPNVPSMRKGVPNVGQIHWSSIWPTSFLHWVSMAVSWYPLQWLFPIRSWNVPPCIPFHSFVWKSLIIFRALLLHWIHRSTHQHGKWRAAPFAFCQHCRTWERNINYFSIFFIKRDMT